MNFSNIAIPAPSLSGTPDSPGDSGQVGAPRLHGKAFNEGLQAQASGKGDVEGQDSDSETIKQLKQMIKDLQKQLAEAQRQLLSISAQPMNEQAKQAALAAQQATILQLTASLMTATSQLLAALTEASQGGKGSLVSTRA